MYTVCWAVTDKKIRLETNQEQSLFEQFSILLYLFALYSHYNLSK